MGSLSSDNTLRAGGKWQKRQHFQFLMPRQIETPRRHAASSGVAGYRCAGLLPTFFTCATSFSLQAADLPNFLRPIEAAPEARPSGRANEYELDEGEINTLGYQLLYADRS
jgi:hypothetical protein